MANEEATRQHYKLATGQQGNKTPSAPQPKTPA